ncbi:MAG: hypothetical protein ACOZAM_11285 [Pseudomonadota bacterium]
MSNFVDRLITRGAGLSTGLPLLKPRPAARFEQEMSPSIEVETPAEPSLVNSAAAPVRRKGSPASTRVEAAQRRVPDQQIRREDDIGEARAPSSQPGSNPLQSRFLPKSETASRPAADLETGPPISVPEPSLSQQIGVEQPEAPRHQRPMFFDVPAGPAIRPEPRIESEPAAPTISIGRIDVQFLPQEAPAHPQRPEPQRTRGFEAYARARRGEPR